MRFKLEENEIWKVWPKSISSENFLASYAGRELQNIVKLYMHTLRDSLNALEAELEELHMHYKEELTKITKSLQDFENLLLIDENFIM